MDDRTLVKISLAWSLIGVFVLIFIASYAEPEQIEIKNLENYVGKTVLIRGEVVGMSARESASFMGISDDSGNTTAVAFEKITNISIGNIVAVKGKVQLYKGEPELIASEIICISC